MNKTQIIEKIEAGEKDINKIKTWINCLPNFCRKQTPKNIRIGDVYFKGELGHPILILGKREDLFLCVLFTTENTTPGIICKANSRFFYDSYITSTILLTRVDMNKFVGVYENRKHITEIKKLLKKTIKL